MGKAYANFDEVIVDCSVECQPAILLLLSAHMTIALVCVNVGMCINTFKK